MKGLLVKQPWIDKILAGQKTWELRGSRARIRGSIALIERGTGTVVGVCELVDVHGPLTRAALRRTTARHRVPATQFRNRLRFRRTYAWQLRGARRLRRPVPYRHPSGAVSWVNLPSGVATAIGRRAIGRSAGHGER
jgi:hypothetical protein